VNKLTETEPVVEVRFVLSRSGGKSKITKRLPRDGKESIELVQALVKEAIEKGGVWGKTEFYPWHSVALVEWNLDQWNAVEKAYRKRIASSSPSSLLGR
jgi:hypothetical protein